MSRPPFYEPGKPIRTRAQAITAGLHDARQTLRQEPGRLGPGTLTPTGLRAKTDGELRRLQDTMPAPDPLAWAYWISIHNTLHDAGFPTTSRPLAHLNKARPATWKEACTP